MAFPLVSSLLMVGPMLALVVVVSVLVRECGRGATFVRETIHERKAPP